MNTVTRLVVAAFAVCLSLPAQFAPSHLVYDSETNDLYVTSDWSPVAATNPNVYTAAPGPNVIRRYVRASGQWIEESPGFTGTILQGDDYPFAYAALGPDLFGGLIAFDGLQCRVFLGEGGFPYSHWNSFLVVGAGAWRMSFANPNTLEPIEHPFTPWSSTFPNSQFPLTQGIPTTAYGVTDDGVDSTYFVGGRFPTTSGTQPWTIYRYDALTRSIDPVGGHSHPLTNQLYNFALAYHSLTGSLVIVGGRQPGAQPTNRQWIWQQGAMSSYVGPKPPAAARSGAASLLGENVILRGGVGPGGVVQGGVTWEWDGTNWTSVTEPGPDGPLAMTAAHEMGLIFAVQDDGTLWGFNYTDRWRRMVRSSVFHEGQEGPGGERIRHNNEVLKALAPSSVRVRLRQAAPNAPAVLFMDATDTSFSVPIPGVGTAYLRDPIPVALALTNGNGNANYDIVLNSANFGLMGSEWSFQWAVASPSLRLTDVLRVVPGW